MTTYYSRRPPRLDSELACSGIECSVTGAVDYLLVLLWLGAIGFVLAALLYLPRARSVCAEERERTEAEARAFGRFADRVTEIDATPTPNGPARATAGSVATSFAQGGGDQGLSEIRSAYRETVMSVSHYDQEYGESLTENVTAEFDPEVAAVVTNGDRVTPQLKRAIVDRAVDARDRREDFLDVLSREADALEDAHDALEDVDATLERLDERPLPERSYDDLEATWHQLCDLERRLETLLGNRQERLRSTAGGGLRFADSLAMYAYLYQPLSVGHPVLADGTRLLEDVTTAKRRVARSLSCRA